MSSPLYSRLISYVTIALPLLGVAILACLILFTQTNDIQNTLPIARTDLENLAQDQRVDRPSFSTVSPDGTAIHLFSRKAFPKFEENFIANFSDVSLFVEFPNRDALQIAALFATLNEENGLAEFSGGVTLQLSKGYTVQAEGLSINMNTATIESSSEVTGQSMFGHFKAGHMQLSQDPETRGINASFSDDITFTLLPNS